MLKHIGHSNFESICDLSIYLFIIFKMNGDIKCSMIAANCNSLLNGADYNMNYGVLAYTAANSIHIYDIKSVRTYLTLNGHSDRVNSVKWMNSNKYNVSLINIE
jgi:WD40 repeat protein